MTAQANDNVAMRAGYTQAVSLTDGSQDLELLVKPGTDYDDRFKAWCTDGQEYIYVNGWQAVDVEEHD